MSTWREVDRSLDDSPLRAPASDFSAVADHFFAFEHSSRSVVEDFVRLTGGDTTRFEGRAAEAFVVTLGEVADDMRDLPAVAGSIGVIFRDHATTLQALQSEADRALAVALTTKAERDAESRTVSTSAAALASIRAQLQSLRSAGAEEIDPQVTHLTGRETSEAGRLTAARSRLQAGDENVRCAVKEYHGYRGREESLNRSTAHRISTVDLRSMSDPSNLEKLGSWAGDKLGDFADYLQEFVSDIVDMVAAAVKGDWNEFFWRLNDVLRTIVTIVGTVLAVVALVVAPGIGVLIAGAILAGLLFISSAGLAAFGGVNSETGRRMDAGTVALDGAGFVLALVGLRSFVSSPLKFSKLHNNKFLHQSVHNQAGQFVKKPIADAFRNKYLMDWSRDHIIDRSIDHLKDLNEAEQERRHPSPPPFSDVRLTPPSSCSGGTRALLGAAA